MFLSYEASLCDHIWSVSSLCRTRLHFPRHRQRHISHQPQRLLHGRVGDRLPPDAPGKPHWPFVLHAELLLCILKANVDSDYTTSKTTRQPQPATTVSRTTTNIKYRSNWSLEADGQESGSWFCRGRRAERVLRFKAALAKCVSDTEHEKMFDFDGMFPAVYWTTGWTRQAQTRINSLLF